MILNSGDLIKYNNSLAKIISRNGSGSTLLLEWQESGETGYYESYGHGVEIKLVKKAPKRNNRRGKK